MKNAKPRDFTFDAVRGYQPAKGKPGGGGTGGARRASSARRGPAGGDILKGTGRVLLHARRRRTTSAPARWSRKYRDTNQSIVLTAGHCATENDGTTAGDELAVHPVVRHARRRTPAANDDLRLLGRRRRLRRDTAFLNAGGFNNTAVAARLVVRGREHRRQDRDLDAQLDATVGVRFPIAVLAASANGNTLSAFGYPAAGKYHGSDLIYCRGAIGQDAEHAATRPGRMAVRHDRRLVRRPVGRGVEHDAVSARGDDPELAQLVRLLGP